MDEEIQSILRRDKAASIQIVVLGGGYDTRSIRTLIRYPQVTRAWELDLKPVVDSKRKLIQRLYCQCPLLAGQSVQTELRFLDVDLNDLDQLDAALAQIVQGQTSAATHTILLTEAVLMYLNEGIPSKILQRCLKRFGPKVSWLFVDRLKDVPNVVSEDLVLSRKAATEYFASDGWEIVDWLLKPGGTRHLGVARALQK